MHNNGWNMFNDKETVEGVFEYVFEEVLHIHPTCYSICILDLNYNVRIYSMEVVHQKQQIL